MGYVEQGVEGMVDKVGGHLVESGKTRLMSGSDQIDIAKRNGV